MILFLEKLISCAESNPGILERARGGGGGGLKSPKFASTKGCGLGFLPQKMFEKKRKQCLN